MLLVFFSYSLSCWLGSCSTIHEKPQVNSLGHWGFHDSLLAAVAILASSFQHWKRFSHETYETYETAQDFHWGLKNSRQEMSPPGTAWLSLTAWPSLRYCTAFGQTSMETISKVTSFLEHNTHSTKWKKCGYHQRHGPVWRHDACLHCNPYVWENTKVRNCCSTTVSTIRHEGASKSRYCVTDRCFATAKDALLVYTFFWLVLCNSCGLPHFALIKQLLLME